MLTFENILQAVLASVRRASMTIRVWGVHMSMCMVYIYIYAHDTYISYKHTFIYIIYIYTHLLLEDDIRVRDTVLRTHIHGGYRIQCRV